MSKSERTGREPYLSGAPIPQDSSGHEPSLGGEHGLKQLRAHKLEQLTKPTTSHLRRAAIGDWLARNGDPRKGIGLNAEGLPDLVWCAVPGGDVLLRDSSDALTIERFYIAKYPITWAQYRIFLEAEDGHQHPYWWDGLRRRAEYDRHDTPVDNQPAQEVSWYDAVAYTRWLSSKMDYDVRLPNEWEWQQAATDGDSERLFPWGNETGTMFANTKESRLFRATAVGMYPAGEAPCGALDMAGTVLEWCANEFAQPERMELTGEARRVLRGGSWYLIYAYARNLFRTGNDPYLRFNSVGFRLVTNSLEPRPRPEPPPPMPEIVIDDAEEADHDVTFPAPDGSIVAADGSISPEDPDDDIDD